MVEDLDEHEENGIVSAVRRVCDAELWWEAATPPSRPDWDTTWMAVADVMAQRSRCSRATIAAVIVSGHQRLVATGYNGTAANYLPGQTGMCDQWCPRARGEAPLDASYDACPAVHAEENAIAYVDRSAVDGGTIYVTAACCMRCAKLISASGLKRVVMRVRAADAHRHPEAVIKYFSDCAIAVEVVKQ